MNSSLERIYPATDASDKRIVGSETLQLHLQRYEFAIKHISPGVILDIACGSGYGSHLVATNLPGARILAVDIDQGAIDYANKYYRHPSIDFKMADAMNYRGSQQPNTVISLETIEHLADPRRFVENLASQLVVGGRFIASAPITPSMDANPYHLQDFTIRSFRKIFDGLGLVEIDSMVQVQQYRPFSLLKKKSGREQGLRKGMFGYYLSHPNKLWLRIRSTFRDGFKNKYVVLVFEKRAL